LGHALPNFWIALMLILFLLLVFDWTPPIFYANSWQDPWIHIQKMIWPTLVLTWGYSAYLIRITRSTMLEVLRRDYIRTARSKGLMGRVVVLRHGLPNALIPVITLGGLQVATLIGGTVIIETVFSLPGIGQGLVAAANERDFPVVQSLTMLLVTLMLTLNLIVDLLYAKVDPRISYA
jgi:peptide/nickel transport system permease protein